ncbi:putative PurR-regulated permease PerM [Isoptericola jiangsuensis]|uniref:Putative PurR-regulated permease PerM n=1 Tax=Isoptericola jiangsuensis TaxID=548579 RepID=A0A2A9EU87_9MICO|nr:AI-2E family transporter [Isoptericola jiangsuensis]PFG42707.1 putative PurR-regulated permease PerM [Isoptericola jiangsuensis]
MTTTVPASQDAPATTAPTPGPGAAPAGLGPTLRTLLGLAAAVVVLGGMHVAGEVLAPLLLAAVIVIICHPVRFPLQARGWPSWLATTAVVVLTYLILAALLAMGVWAGFRFAALVREFLPQLGGVVEDLQAQLAAAGLDTQVADAVTTWLQPSNIVSVAGTVSGTALGIGTAFFFVLAYAVFMAADGSRYATARPRFGRTRADAIDRAERFSSGVRRYYVVNASFGAVVALVDGVALALLQVPGAAIWAILAFVTNFVPNIGFVLGLVPPAVMALVVGGWQLALGVVAVYCVVNVVLQVFVQPKFVADAVSLSLTLSFVSVVFWTFVIGPLGAILSIPLTLLVRALVLEGDPRNVWLRWLSGDDVDPDDDPGPTPTGSDDPAVAAARPAVTAPAASATTGRHLGTADAPAGDHVPAADPAPAEVSAGTAGEYAAAVDRGEAPAPAPAPGVPGDDQPLRDPWDDVDSPEPRSAS